LYPLGLVGFVNPLQDNVADTEAHTLARKREGITIDREFIENSR
jgi:hypothetical protein